MTSSGGLLRFTGFLRDIHTTVVDNQENRGDHVYNAFSSEIQWSDLQTTLIIGIAVYVLRIFAERRVFPSLFRAYSKRTQRKLAENLFYLIYYTFAFAFYLTMVRPSVQWNVNLLSNQEDVVDKLLSPFPPPMNQWERLHYALACGFYSSASVFILAFDLRRADFHEFVIHHTVTLSMVVASYLYGYVRTGIIIIALHDVGDIFLYGAKFIHYLGLKGLDTAIFAVFAVTFYITRLVMYSRIVHTVTVSTLQKLIEEPSFNNWAMYFDTYKYHWLFFVICLSTLLFLHCFWFSLILKMIYRELFLGDKITDQGDIRSDDEEEDDLDDSPEEEDALFEDQIAKSKGD